jgi:hypothetical protein
VSITNINFNSGQNTAEVSFQFFTDDFIKIILSNVKNENSISQRNKLEDESIKDIGKYIFSKFSIEINYNTELRFDFQHIKQDEESVRIYYKCVLPEDSIENIKLTNKLMLDMYPDQTNLVILDINGTEKGFTFNQRKSVINIRY